MMIILIRELQRCVMRNLPSPEAVAAANRALDSGAALMSGSGDAMIEALRIVMNDPNNPANWKPPDSRNEQDNSQDNRLHPNSLHSSLLLL
jgi:hypothetical protein